MQRLARLSDESPTAALSVLQNLNERIMLLIAASSAQERSQRPNDVQARDYGVEAAFPFSVNRLKQGKDLCRRRNARTGAECSLADTHYPRPHRALDGSQWHDGLCPNCLGTAETTGGTCSGCQGAGFIIIEPGEP